MVERLVRNEKVRGSNPLTSTNTGCSFGGIAQLVEHLLCKQGVRGSNPLASTTPVEAGKARKLEARKAEKNAQERRKRGTEFGVFFDGSVFPVSLPS